MLFDRKFRYNIVQTGLVQVFSLASFVILLVFVLPRFISKPDLGLYVTFRALIASLFPLYTVALDIAQARYLGYHTGESDEQRSVTSTVLIVFFIVAIISTSLLFLAKSFILNHFFDHNISMFYALTAALIFTSVSNLYPRKSSNGHFDYNRSNKRYYPNRLVCSTAAGYFHLSIHLHSGNSMGEKL